MVTDDFAYLVRSATNGWIDTLERRAELTALASAAGALGKFRFHRETADETQTLETKQEQ